MKLINKETGDELVEVKSSHDGGQLVGQGAQINTGRYASKGVAGTALGLGIAGTALALLNGGAMALFGNRNGGGSGLIGSTTNVDVKCSENRAQIIDEMWSLAYNNQLQRFADRNQINAEMFGLYKSQIDADFLLYKGNRDGFDALKSEISDLKAQVAVNTAVRPYQDALIQCEINNVATQAAYNLERRTCRMIEGQNVLVSTPTVTGIPGYRCCCPAATTPAPTEA